jgi:hypothetical protein
VHHAAADLTGSGGKAFNRFLSEFETLRSFFSLARPMGRDPAARGAS